MRRKILVSVMVASSLLSAAAFGQGGAATISARAGIDAGNQAWIDGVKSGDVALIIATYAEDAVDCDPTGDCIRGRLQIEQHMKAQLRSRGRARLAKVKTWGSSEQGNFAYEWGQAEATFDGAKGLTDKYLTVWHRQTDGSWKIFRNMVIPNK
jgi:ketosteroid isomerase-like protein